MTIAGFRGVSCEWWLGCKPWLPVIETTYPVALFARGQGYRATSTEGELAKA